MEFNRKEAMEMLKRFLGPGDSNTADSSASEPVSFRSEIQK